ncbi:MAG: hypothetical protein KDI33_18460 [Halioglobus sp.]|nr:hypothetical protein [Halioglobus sp.]
MTSSNMFSRSDAVQTMTLEAIFSYADKADSRLRRQDTDTGYWDDGMYPREEEQDAVATHFLSAGVAVAACNKAVGAQL